MNCMKEEKDILFKHATRISVGCVTLSTRCIMKIIISLAGPEGNMKQILHSYWLPRQPRWANQVCLMYGADLQSLKFFLTMLAMEPQKSGRRKSKQRKKSTLVDLLCYKYSWLSFPACRIT